MSNEINSQTSKITEEKKDTPWDEETENESLKDIFHLFHFIYKDKIRNK